MSDFPVLPFEKVLSYLSLEDLLKSRVVCRSWCQMIDSFKVKTLCFSEHPSGFMYGKHRWVRGAFAQNFIVSTRFESFFKSFGKTILSHLKYLRLYAVDLHKGSRTAFTRALNSLSQLEELDLLHFSLPYGLKRRQLKLNLPRLKKIHLKEVRAFKKLTLSAPLLKEVQVSVCAYCLEVDLVYGESVERLLVDRVRHLKVESLKNLKHLYLGSYLELDLNFNIDFDFSFLSALEHLKTIHLINEADVRPIFELKQRYCRADLKVYRLGCLVDGPNDPAMNSDFDLFSGENFLYLAANPSRMADEIPFLPLLSYVALEGLDPELQATILNRLTDLRGIRFHEPIRDIERSLNFLKTFSYNLPFALIIFPCDQPQDLYDRLPEYCRVQRLIIAGKVSDFEFLFRLGDLIELWLFRSIASESLRRALEELEFLKLILLRNLSIRIEKSMKTPKRYKVYADETKKVETCNLNAVILFIEQTAAEQLDRMEVD